MNGLSLGQFMERFNAEKRLKPVLIFWMVGVVIAGAAQMAGAALTISPVTLLSAEPCLFEEHLPESTSIRNQYTAKLVVALSGAVSESNSLEDMDNDITPGSYREGEIGRIEPTANFTTSPATLQSTGPCSFAEQLQESASIRNQYTAKLIAATGGTVSARNSLEDMDGNLTPESYRKGESGQTEPTVIFWGIEIKQSIRSIGIDSLSAGCLGCHDGVAALSVTTVLKNDPFKISGLSGSDLKMIGMDHPIGMDYNRYVAAGKGYKPLLGINNKMVFVNGKVGCLSCHDSLNPEKGHLVISDRNSALCYTCHDK